MAADEPTIAAARARVGARARETLERGRSFVGRAAALLAAPAALRDSAREQLAALNSGEVRARLRERPVTMLREAAGKGVRLGALEQAGFRTIADVLEAPPHRLLAVPGIGPRTAEQVTAAARRVAAQVTDDTRLRIDPDRRGPGETRLLATLAAIRQADDTTAALGAGLDQFTSGTPPLLAEADRTGSRLSMTFARRGTKDAALRALARLDAVLADPRVVALERAVREREWLLDPASHDPEQLWRDYAADAASFHALLSTLGGVGVADDQDAAGGFVPAELRQQITAIPLDTSLLRATLRGYQVFGAQYSLHQQRSMLGDEMGLGKTVQALAVLAHLTAQGQRRFLVVCPASVLINWLNEIEKHSRLKAHSLHGPDRDSAARFWLRNGGVAVTTFGTLGALANVRGAEVAMLVVDEAHYVKNPDAQRSQVVASVMEEAQRTLFLTGTPMENRVEEFRHLVGYLQPGVASSVDVTDAVAGARAFRRAVAPVYLRRNQEDVLTELPDRIEVEDWVQLSPADDTAYRDAVRSRNLMAMRQAAFHAGESAKLERLHEIVAESAADGLKVLVFSYFLGVLGTIGRRLGPAAMGPITGAVSPAARQQLVDEFTRRDGHAVLLSQVEAGGVGLNMPAASVVILTEPQWKPSTEEQAIARAHRMGQIRKVQVHRLLAKGSVDERLREIQERKSLLFDEFARKSDAKDADARAVDATVHRPAVLDDDSVPLQQRIVLAEQHRLGIG